MRAILKTGAVACLMVLTACISIPSAPPGPFKVGGAQVTLGREWSDVSAIMPGKVKQVRVLSIDGPLLNRLYLSGGLAPGEPLIKAPAKDKPTPKVRTGMTSAERIEFVTDSIAAMDFQRVEAAKPRAARYGGQPAVRFDITAQTSEGLDLAGTAMAAEIAGKTYVILYLAPAEHYFAANLAEVEQVMASAQPGA